MDGKIIKKKIIKFVSENFKICKFYKSMGQLNYLSTLKYVDGVVGNSSSGITEVPSYKIGTINIGDRQKGRIKAKSIIDCHAKKKSLKKAIKKLYSKKFKDELKKVHNPYDFGGASRKIFNIIKNNSLPKNIKKDFYDIWKI